MASGLAWTTWMILLVPVLGGKPAPAPPARLKAVVDEFPIDSIQGPHRDRIREILRKPTVWHRGEADVFPCHPVLLEWLFDHPIWVAQFWNALGLQASPLKAIDGGYECREGTAVARFFVAHASPEMRVVYCVGEADHPLMLNRIRADMVLVLRYRFAKHPDGKYFVIQQMDAFVCGEGPAIKAIMKLARATFSEVLEACMRDVSVYFNVICRTMQLKPEWSMAVLSELAKAGPAAEAEELAGILRTLPPVPPTVQVLPAEFMLQPTKQGTTGKDQGPLLQTGGLAPRDWSGTSPKRSSKGPNRPDSSEKSRGKSTTAPLPLQPTMKTSSVPPTPELAPAGAP